MLAGIEALKSEDCAIIKYAREKKVHFMIGYRKIEGLLSKNDDQFDHKQISELDVNKYQ